MAASTAAARQRVIARWLLLSALTTLACARPVMHPGIWAKPDYSIYHNKDSLLLEVKQIVDRHPDIMKMEVRHSEDKGYAVDMQVVTVEVGGHTSDHSRKLRVLIDFGEHARELVSSETGLQLLRTLADLNEVERITGTYSRRILDLLSHVVFIILPMENTRGRDKVEAGDLCERKNGRGVDPNRNYMVHWGVKERDYDPKEEYPGEYPLSEPEVQIVSGIVRQWKPHVWVNVHSGMEALFMPFDHQAVIPTGVGGLAQLGILKHLNSLICGNRCAVGSGGKSVGYLAHGTATDHMFVKEDVPLSFTWEIYGDMKAHYMDCFRMFNPLTREHLESVVNAWTSGFLYLVALLPNHPTIRQFMEQNAIPLTPLADVDAHRILGAAPAAHKVEGVQSVVGGDVLPQQPPPHPAVYDSPPNVGGEEKTVPSEQKQHRSSSSVLRDRSASLLQHPVEGMEHAGVGGVSAASGRPLDSSLMMPQPVVGSMGFVSGYWGAGLGVGGVAVLLLLLLSLQARSGRCGWYTKRFLRALRPDPAKADEPEGRER